MKKLVVVALAVACGGDAGVAPPSKPPPRSVLALQVAVPSGGGDDTFCPALAAGLARSGILVTADPGQQADATIRCRATTSQDDGFFRVTVNGQTRVRFTVRIEVRATGNDTLVDSFVAEYKGYRGGAPDEDVVSKAVLGFAYSPRIAAFARAVRRAHASEAAPVATATTAEPVATNAPPPPRADTRDDADWYAVDTVKCKIPARVEACDGVRRYLHRHPDGAHAQEANAVLAAARPALEKLQKDEVAWRKANHSLCSRRRTSDACVGVEAYEIQFPTGLHAEEAHRLLKNAGVDK
jgi:hypothetical protein